MQLPGDQPALVLLHLEQALRQRFEPFPAAPYLRLALPDDLLGLATLGDVPHDDLSALPARERDRDAYDLDVEHGAVDRDELLLQQRGGLTRRELALDALAHDGAVVGVDDVERGAAHELLDARGVQQLERRPVGDDPASVLMDEDRFGRVLEQGAVALLALARGLLRLAPLGGHGREHQPGDRQEREVHLQEQQVVRRRRAHEGALSVDGEPDGQRGDDAGRGRRAEDAEPQRGPDDEREDGVFIPRRRPQQYGGEAKQAHEQHACLGRPRGGPPGPPRVRPGEQQGSDQQVAHRVARPPHEPEMPRGRTLDHAARPQAQHADRRAHEGADERREGDEREDIAQPREGGSEVRDPPEQ